MADVFISHSTKDKETADKAVAYLEERGISCWIAPRNIVAGSDWAAAISAAITSAKIFLLIYSENSAASEQCAREMNLAETIEGLFVVPYKADNAPLTGTYQYYLTGAHWIFADAKKNNYNFDELFTMLSGILGNANGNTADSTYTDTFNVNKVSVSVPDVKPVKSGRKKLIFVGVAGAAAVTGIIVAAVLLSSGVGKVVPPEPEALTTTGTTESITETAVSASPNYGTISDYSLTYNNVVIEGTYTGGLNATGQPEGSGEVKGTYSVLNVKFTATVTGDFSNGMLNGSASIILTSASGSREKHESDSIVNGRVNGIERSTITLENGTETTTEVEMIHGIANGIGKGNIKYPNGDTETFELCYADGMINGEGKSVYNYTEGSTEYGFKTRTYIGTYKDNMKCGKGSFTLEYYSGVTEVYEGEFDGDDFGGQGTLMFTYPASADGDALKTVVSSGIFRNGTMNGQGKRTDEYVSGERKVYEGNFSGGMYEGEGTLTAYYAEEDEKMTDVYTGEFKSGYFEGKGKKVTEYKDGDSEIIEGDWIKGETNGSIYYECIYAEPKGDAGMVRESYSGYVKNGIKNGMAMQKLYLADGTVISINGEWNDNAPVDGCIVSAQNAEGDLIRSGLWKNGTIEWQQAD